MPPGSIRVPAELLTMRTLPSPNVLLHWSQASRICGTIVSLWGRVFKWSSVPPCSTHNFVQLLNGTYKAIVLVKDYPSVSSFMKGHKVYIADVFFPKGSINKWFKWNRTSQIHNTFHHHVRQYNAWEHEHLKGNKKPWDIQWHAWKISKNVRPLNRLLFHMVGNPVCLVLFVPFRARRESRCPQSCAKIFFFSDWLRNTLELF